MEITKLNHAQKVAENYNCLGAQIAALSDMAQTVANEKVELRFGLVIHQPSKVVEKKPKVLDLSEMGTININDIIGNDKGACACCTHYEESSVEESSMLKIIACLIRDKKATMEKIKIELAELGVTV